MKLFTRILRKIKKIYRYENKLIADLKNDHQTLFELFSKIEKNTKKKNYSKIQNLLKKFHYEYRLHILYEENYFYTYMKKKYTKEPDIFNFIDKKQKEMTVISKKIENFVKYYNSTDKLKSSSFEKELKKLGEILYKRIEFEESKLYILYS